MPTEVLVASSADFGKWRENMKEQERSLWHPVSPTETYYAYVSKFDWVEDNKAYDILFEIIPKEWAEHAILSKEEDEITFQYNAPTAFYHIPEASKEKLYRALQVTEDDGIAEGDWFEIIISDHNDELPGLLYQEILNPDTYGIK